MYQTNRIYKNYISCFIYILLCLHNVDVQGIQISEFSPTNGSIDVTTIYRITNISNINDGVGFMDAGFLSTYKHSYTIEIHSRTNAVGIPIPNPNYELLQTNVKELFNIKTFGSFVNSSRLNISCDKDWGKKYYVFDGDYWREEYSYNNVDCYSYSTTTPSRHYLTSDNTDIKRNQCFYAYKFNFQNYVRQFYNYGKPIDNFKLFSLYWTPDRDYTCLSITYMYLNTAMRCKLDISMRIYDKNGVLISEVILEKKQVSVMKIYDIDFIKDQNYVLSLEIMAENYHCNVHEMYGDVQFRLFQIAQCSDNDEDVQKVSSNYFVEENYHPVHILYFQTLKDNMRSRSREAASCLNGGYQMDSAEEICVCPPGFIGTHCETGCGMNSYGADCNGVCSMKTNETCRGMLMCTKYGCTCPVGLTGPLCDKDCESGKYGANCTQNCSSNCRSHKSSPCDPYTGLCLNGCSPGYILPYCLEKYPHLINAPKPIAIEYESIKFELNFQSHNVEGGDESIHVKYYQLNYKALNEENFSSSEIKLINQDDNVTTEILNDLQPKTEYLVGVLLITDDGNFNDQDIVYDKYETSCVQPKIIDYNLKLVSGVKSINVTWNKVTSNRFECDVTSYVLTLEFNQTHNIINYPQTIITNSDRSHFIDNLLPGYQYDVKLTPITIKGSLPSSPTYSITTLNSENDVKIKSLSHKIDFGKIKLDWKLANSYQNNGRIVEPVTCIIRYKIVRILSCSLKEVERNWTLVKVFNQTNYEIFNVIPNTQYSVQVFVDKDSNVFSNEYNPDSIEQKMIYVLTPESNPKTEPILDHTQQIYVTNNSVSVQWKVDPENCSKLNGFFSKYYVELKEKFESASQIKETKHNYISLDDLKPNTAYELKIFIKNNVGYNPEHFLFVNFTTKYDDLMPVDDLMVYKKSLKNRMAGFRWSYTENSNIDAFIVLFNDTTSVIPLERCSAWPHYYCHTFYNLSASNSYTFKIMPRSVDYPDGGKVASISFNSIDGLPDPPMNLKATEIGNTTIALQWDIPWIFNGVIKMFNINVEEISALNMNTCCVSITPIEIPVVDELPAYHYTVTDLKPGSTYSIGVLTVSKSLWYSSPSRISVETLH